MIDWRHRRSQERTTHPHVEKGDPENRTKGQRNQCHTRPREHLLKMKHIQGAGRSGEMTQKMGKEKPPQRTRSRSRISNSILMPYLWYLFILPYVNLEYLSMRFLQKFGTV